MSVINQVVNRLEQRGLELEDGESVHAVHASRDSGLLKIALVVVLLVALFMIFWRIGSIYMNGRHSAPEAPNVNNAIPAAASAGKVIQPLGTEMLPAQSGLVLKLSPSASLDRLPEEAATPLLTMKHDRVESGQVGERTIPKTERATAVQTVQEQQILPPIKQISAAQKLDAEFRRALEMLQQGHVIEAQAVFENVIRQDPGHDAARQALISLLMDTKRNIEAEQVLIDGLNNRPNHTGFIMLLARLQIERNALDQALSTLEAGLPYAEQLPEYHAFYAALLQRKLRHQDAVKHYRFALNMVPDKGIWLMGYGISLQALAQTVEAKQAYQKALDTHTLSPGLQVFVQQKLKGL